MSRKSMRKKALTFLAVLVLTVSGVSQVAWAAKGGGGTGGSTGGGSTDTGGSTGGGGGSAGGGGGSTDTGGSTGGGGGSAGGGGGSTDTGTGGGGGSTDPGTGGSTDSGNGNGGGNGGGNGTDSGSTDSGSTDSGSTDSGSTDSGSTDAGSTDSGHGNGNGGGSDNSNGNNSDGSSVGDGGGDGNGGPYNDIENGNGNGNGNENGNGYQNNSENNSGPANPQAGPSPSDDEGDAEDDGDLDAEDDGDLDAEDDGDLDAEDDGLNVLTVGICHSLPDASDHDYNWLRVELPSLNAHLNRPGHGNGDVIFGAAELCGPPRDVEDLTPLLDCDPEVEVCDRETEELPQELVPWLDSNGTSGGGCGSASNEDAPGGLVAQQQCGSPYGGDEDTVTVYTVDPIEFEASRDAWCAANPNFNPAVATDNATWFLMYNVNNVKYVDPAAAQVQQIVLDLNAAGVEAQFGFYCS